jgi:glutamate N-acetyltransferase / amino-acid N-acetyltransferase
MKISPLAPKNYPVMPAIEGVKIATINAGIKYRGRDEMLLLSFAGANGGEGAHVAGVYTRSQTAAAPVVWCRAACGNGFVRALLVNAGNANAFTGTKGIADNYALAEAVAKCLHCAAEDVMICSTGVIGEFLPIDKMVVAVGHLGEGLQQGNWEQAAKTIMTTDTFPKMLTRTAKIGNATVTINGIAKGSGMIAPDMATMLGFIVTDANLPSYVLQPLLARYAQKTFNSITVDSDTSTNDTLLLMATGAVAHAPINNAGDELLAEFKVALRELMQELAVQIVCDGEGASKLITINVAGAENEESARIIGLSIANSPLVKTALAASDPNWGRIIAAIGKSGRWVNENNITLHIGEELVAKGACVAPSYSEAKAKEHLMQPQVQLSIDVGVGEGKATVWTCDFTEDYIKINANYRT